MKKKVVPKLRQEVKVHIVSKISKFSTQDIPRFNCLVYNKAN